MSNYTVPPDNRTTQSSGHLADHTNIANDLSLLQMYSPSGDATGATDLTAINASLAANSVTQLVSGTYYIDGPIVMASNSTLQGFGPEATVVNQVATTSDGIAMNQSSGNLSNPRVQGLALIGPDSGSGRGISAIADSGSDAVIGIALRDVFMRYFGGVGVDLDVSITGVLENVQTWNCTGGFYLHGGGTSMSLTSCYANGCTAAGYNLNAQAYSSLNGCACDSGYLGYEITNCEGITLNGCGAESMLDAGGFSGDSFEINAGTGNTLSGCYTNQSPSVSFWVTGSAVNMTLISCYEKNPAEGATASFKTDSGTSAVIINPAYTTAVSYASGTAYTIIATGGTAH